jgi:hypothetical protein
MAGGPRGNLPKRARGKKEKRARAATDEGTAYDIFRTGGSLKAELRRNSAWTVR